MKRIILITLSAMALFIAGCKTDRGYENGTCSQTTNSVMSTQFNEEHYIWENWIFPSNKTTGK